MNSDHPPDHGDSRFAALPEPPYYAVIFSSRRTDLDPEQLRKQIDKIHHALE